MDLTLGPPDLEAHSDAPRYNILAVERATELSPRTLRSWERRYGIPTPRRDSGGRRLYSDRDIALIRWLKDRVEGGMAISRAVAMLSEADERVSDTRAQPDLDHLQLRLLQAIDWMDEEEVTATLTEAVAGAPVDVVALDLIQPVLYRIGELWAGGRLSVASEHFGTHLLRSALADLLRNSGPVSRPHHILVGCPPGELHDVGALTLALFLRRAGFRVTYLGASLESQSLEVDLARLKPHAVCLSATTDSAAAALGDLYRRMQSSYSGILAYGGSAFRDGAAGYDSIPGVYLGPDVCHAVEELPAALERRRSES